MTVEIPVGLLCFLVLIIGFLCGVILTHESIARTIRKNR